MTKLSVEIGPLTKDELGVVEELLNFDWGNPQKHQERLDMQQRDELIYLIAWIEGQPVGHAVLEWAGKTHDALACKVRDCPHVDDLFVHPEQRSKGIGTQLLDRAQNMAVRRGYRCVGIGVAIDNHRRWHQESCYYLVKSL